MLFVYGFAGLRDYSGELRFHPALPKGLDCLRFELMFQGQVLEIHIGQEQTRYSLKTGSGFQLRHEEEEIQLSADVPTIACPNRKYSEHAVPQLG